MEQPLKKEQVQQYIRNAAKNKDQLFDLIHLFGTELNRVGMSVFVEEKSKRNTITDQELTKAIFTHPEVLKQLEATDVEDEKDDVMIDDIEQVMKQVRDIQREHQL